MRNCPFRNLKWNRSWILPHFSLLRQAVSRFQIVSIQLTRYAFVFLPMMWLLGFATHSAGFAFRIRNYLSPYFVQMMLFPRLQKPRARAGRGGRGRGRGGAATFRGCISCMARKQCFLSEFSLAYIRPNYFQVHASNVQIARLTPHVTTGKAQKFPQAQSSGYNFQTQNTLQTYPALVTGNRICNEGVRITKKTKVGCNWGDMNLLAV